MRTASWRALALVFLIALAIRLVHLWQVSQAPFFLHLLGDSRGYDAWAQQLAAGDWLGNAVFYQAPLYPYWLGSLYSLLGHDLLSVRVVQILVGACSCVLLTAATTRWIGPKAGILAGLLLAAYAPAIFFDGLIQKSVLDGLLVAGLLLALSPRAEAWVTFRPAVSGALLGLLTSSRENAIALLPVLAATSWLGGRRRLAPALIAIAATGLVLAPVGIRNLSVGGEWHLTTSQLGPNFYIGNNPDATGVYVPLKTEHGSFRDERQDATRLAEAALHRQARPSEVSNYFLDRGLEWIRSAPGTWLRLTARKVLLLLNGTEAADTEDIATHAEWSLPLRMTAAVFHFGVLAPIALGGMWITRRRWRDLWPLYAVFAVFAGSVVVFYVMDRYRYPLAPVLLVFAGAALADGWEYWKTHSGLERGRIVVLLAAAVLLCNLPMLSSKDMQAVTHYNIGVALSDAHLDDQAEGEYRTAIALQPALAAPHTNLGALLGASGNLAEALAECREAVRLSPRSASAYTNLGVVLGSLGNVEESIAVMTRALQLDPDSAEAHYNLAKGLQAVGQNTAAMEHLRETIRLQPERAMAYNNLGVLLCQRGQLAEGIDQLRIASKLDPESREYAANLEHALQLSRRPQ